MYLSIYIQSFHLLFYYTVTIRTQPRDVTVPLGGTAVFTCLVVGIFEYVNNSDIKWDHMGNTIMNTSTNPYMVINNFAHETTQVKSTLIITNVSREHVGPYLFVLDLNFSDVMSRRATLTVLIGTQIFSVYLHLFLGTA